MYGAPEEHGSLKALSANGHKSSKCGSGNFRRSCGTIVGGAYGLLNEHLQLNARYGTGSEKGLDVFLGKIQHANNCDAEGKPIAHPNTTARSSSFFLQGFTDRPILQLFLGSCGLCGSPLFCWLKEYCLAPLQLVPRDQTHPRLSGHTGAKKWRLTMQHLKHHTYAKCLLHMGERGRARIRE